MTHPRPLRAALTCLFALALAVVLGGGGCANGGGTSGGGGGDDGSIGDVVVEGAEASGCPAGKTMCGSTCTNTGNDPKNCGKCGTACPTGQVCSMGMCGYSCSGGETLCGLPPEGGTGMDATSGGDTGAQDATGGGDTGASEAGTVDSGGGTPEAGGGMPDAGGPTAPYCANTGNDPNNCGGCGIVCGPMQTCSNGSCACGPGEKLCVFTGTCIPANSCCNSGDCSIGGEICPSPGSTCQCPGGERECTKTNSCISSNDCCTNTDCMGIMGATCPTAGQACQCSNGDKLCIALKICVPTADCCSPTDCMAPNVQMYTCGTTATMGGTCGIGTCNAGCYDLDKQYPDGCECCDDMAGKSCGAATALGSLSLGAAAVTRTGKLPNPTDGDWYQVTFNSENNTAFHGLIQLTTGGGEFVFDVIKGSCSGSPMNCGEGGACTGKTAWEESYVGPSPPADPSNPGFTPIAAVGAVWIHVYRANTSMTSCNPYTLSVQE